MGRPHSGTCEQGAVTDRDVLEITPRFGPEFERITVRGQDTVRDQQIFGGPSLTQGETGLGYDGIVPGFDVAVRDAHVMAAVRIDAVGIAVADGDAVHKHVIGAE